MRSAAPNAPVEAQLNRTPTGYSGTLVFNVGALMELRWPGWLTRRARAGRLSRLGASAFQNSTLAELAWQRARNASTRWAVWGAVIGTLVGLIVFAPASWLAAAVAHATDQRLLLADAKGSVWGGDAQLVLTGGAGSRDAAALPGRLRWQVRPRLNGFELALNQACCIDREWVIQFRLGLGRYQILLPARPGARPLACGMAGGLGTPFNTCSWAALLLTSNGMTLNPQGSWRMIGSINADLLGVRRACRRSTHWAATASAYAAAHQRRPGHVEPGNTRRQPAPVGQRTMDGFPRAISR